MVSANDLPQTEDSTMNGSGSSSVICSEVAAQENGQLRLAQSLKNYQSKSSEEVAAILQQWKEVKEEYRQNKVDFKQFVPELTLVRKTISFHQACYVVRTKNLPSTIDLGQLSAEQLQSFHEALDHDNKAGEATWKLYDMHKKMTASENAFEKLIAFREEHFVLEEPEQQLFDERKTSIADGRLYIRETAHALMKIREKCLELSERGA
ncbi:hypothetical protein KCU78_g2107, partial [Aureobasidium melanogenum]